MLVDVAAENGHGAHANGQGEEGLAHGRVGRLEEDIRAAEDLREVRQQVEGHAVGRPRKGERAHHEHPQDGEQGEHHGLGDAFHALLHPQRADEDGDDAHHRHPEDAFHRRGQHGVEDGRGGLRVGPHELPGGELRHVGEHPTGHRGVEHHEQIAPGDAHPFVLVPVSARRLQHVEGPGDGALGAAAHGELHDHDGQSQDHQEDEVHDEEGRAAVLAGDVGEAPDVAEADGAAGGDEDEPQTTAESLTFQ